MSNTRQSSHHLNRVTLTGSTKAGALTLNPPQIFNSFIRQIVVLPTTRTGDNPTIFNFYIVDEAGEIFRMNQTEAYLNTAINSQGEQQPPLELPAYGTLTVYIAGSKDSTNAARDEAYTVLIYYE